MEQTESILQRIREMLVPLGFEIYPFKVGWYNEPIEKKYKLPCKYDTLGVLVLSIPDMWEKAFIPFAKKQDWANWNKEKNPLHECMIYNFEKAKQSFPEHDVEVMHQFESVPNKQAKILVQTAAHVAGAAYYYQRRDVTDQPWPADENIYGACYHPVYGGWVSLDGVFIFKDVLCPDLPQQAPQDVFPNREERIELLKKYNTPPWSFRDLLPVPRKYAEEHENYLSSNLDQKIAIAKRIGR
ncbi:cyanocobalamin reductase / alkylcobalamin dealkylase-like [Crassostrea virginica]